MKKMLAVLAAAMMMAGCSTAAAPEAEKPAEGPEWNKEVDVLIVGSGASGVSAAIEARKAGAENVMIIEKQDDMKGVTYFCEGIMSGYETQLDKELDIHLTADDAYEQIMRESYHSVDPALARITADNCGPTIDWLIDEVKVPFEKRVDADPNYGPKPFLHHVEGKGQGFKEPFKAKLEELNVPVEFNTKAVKLLGNEAHDEVIGVEAETADGNIRIKADSVVLCTGGYSANTDLIHNLNNRADVYTGAGMAGSTGDAIYLASEFGANIQNGLDVKCYLGSYDKNGSNGLFTIQVGANGERYIDETMRITTKNYDTMVPTRHRMHVDNVDYVWSISDHAQMSAVNADNIDADFVVKGDTIAELAANMGVDADVLEATVARWNEMVDKGVDEDFGRTENLVKIEEGPFYAAKNRLYASLTYGGVVRNELGEVVKYSGEKIPGLYVAGEAAVAANTNGWTITHAFVWGRIAGENAGKYAVSK